MKSKTANGWARTAWACVLAIALAGAAGRTAAVPEKPRKDRSVAGFEARAREHIAELVALGPRPVGSANEGRAAAWVARQFAAMGIPARLEPFAFETFEADHIELWIGDKRFTPTGLGLDPYAGGASLSYVGGYHLLDPRSPAGWPSAATIAGKAIVTSEAGGPSLHFRLSALQPKLIIYLPPGDFERVQILGGRELNLSVRGELVRKTSLNVIARLGPNPPAPQIIAGAHLDSYRDCPGASDNASGIAALLELAHALKNIHRPEGLGLTFVAFGGEEAGVLGSRLYVERHGEELKDCPLAVVFDDLGGEGPVQVERIPGPPGPATIPGISRIPGAYQGRSWEGSQSRWRLVPPRSLFADLGAFRQPDGLAEAIGEAAKDLGFEVEFTGIQGSDGMSFDLAGIPAVGLSAASGASHTQADRPENVHIERIRQGMETALGIIRRVGFDRDNGHGAKARSAGSK